MYYVYLLYSEETRKWYLGSTNDLRKRLHQHNAGLSRSTLSGMPWRLVYYEAFSNDHAARIREQKLKAHGKGLAELKKRITLADEK
jgi:putative endonuclease